MCLCRDVRLHPTQMHDFSELYDRIEKAQARGLQLVRVAECVYMDAYTAPGKKAASATSVVVSSAQETYENLQELDAYHCLGQIPKGCNSKDAMMTFEPEWQELGRGFEAAVGPANDKRDSFVYGHVFLGLADFPEAQEHAGMLSQRANHPDRFSHASQADLGDLSFDVKANRKTLQHMRAVRVEQKRAPRSKATKERLKKNGMHEVPSVFERIAFDPTAAFPPVHDHSEILGMLGKAVRLFLLDLTKGGRQVFVTALHGQWLPPHWSPLTTPRVSTKDGNKLQMGVVDLEHFIQVVVCAIAGDILDLPPARKRPAEHKEARATRVTYTAEALPRVKQIKPAAYFNMFCSAAQYVAFALFWLVFSQSLACSHVPGVSLFGFIFRCAIRSHKMIRCSGAGV